MIKTTSKLALTIPLIPLKLELNQIGSKWIVHSIDRQMQVSRFTSKQEPVSGCPQISQQACKRVYRVY